MRRPSCLPVVDTTQVKTAVIAAANSTNLTITDVIIACVERLCYLPRKNDNNKTLQDNNITIYYLHSH